MPIVSFFPPLSKKPLTVIENYPSVGGVITYNGEEQSPIWINYNPATVTVSGDIKAINAGTYTTVFTPNEGYCWRDESVEPYSINWDIGKSIIFTIPTQSNTLTYTGEEQLPTWNNYFDTQLVISVTPSVNAGDYIAEFTPKPNYQWADSTVDTKQVQWSIKRAIIALIPIQSSSLVYDGNSLSPSWDNYNTSELSISGSTTGINAGDYNAIFTPTLNYQWADGSVVQKSVVWTIERATIGDVPTQAGSLTYTGESLSPSWDEYDTSTLLVGGTLSAINAGGYDAIFTPTDNYKWTDGNTSGKTARWTISKASGSITLSATSITLDSSNISKQITVTRLGDGTITAKSEDTSVATVSVNDNIITVTGKTSGNTVITVSVGEGTNYTEATATSCDISVEIIGTLEETPWSLISKVSLAGNAPNYWSVGDTKSVKIKGNIGQVSYDTTLYVYILGFDHNPTYEDSSSNIHFGCFKTSSSGGVDVCLTEGEDIYGVNPNNYDKYFRMNHSKNANSSGGWKDCDMRYDILGSVHKAMEEDALSTTATSPVSNTLMAALPSDLRAVLRPMRKFSDNTGDDTTITVSEANNMKMADFRKRITATTDYLPLLSFCEVTGNSDGYNEDDEDSAKYTCNWAEYTRVRQYDYYKNGNSFSKWRYYPDNTFDDNIRCYFWTRSACIIDEDAGCWMVIDSRFDNINDAIGRDSYKSYGIAPIFKV